MADAENTPDLTVRILREIQSDLADMRYDRTVLVSILNRHDTSIDGFSAELRAMRSQLDRFRNEVREGLREIRDRLDGIEGKLDTRHSVMAYPEYTNPGRSGARRWALPIPRGFADRVLAILLGYRAF